MSVHYPEVPLAWREPMGPYYQAPEEYGGEWWKVTPFGPADPWKYAEPPATPPLTPLEELVGKLAGKPPNIDTYYDIYYTDGKWNNPEYPTFRDPNMVQKLLERDTSIWNEWTNIILLPRKEDPPVPTTAINYLKTVAIVGEPLQFRIDSFPDSRLAFTMPGGLNHRHVFFQSQTAIDPNSGIAGELVTEALAYQDGLLEAGIIPAITHPGWEGMEGNQSYNASKDRGIDLRNGFGRYHDGRESFGDALLKVTVEWPVRLKKIKVDG